jgi:transposase
VARWHEHVVNQRRGFWHKLTFWLVQTYGLIALEQLELSFMTHNSHLALSAHDASLGAFQTLLCDKGRVAGGYCYPQAP